MTTKKPHRLQEAPSGPGAPPRWASGSKSGGGTSCSDASLVWFTLGRGVINEVYYPRVDSPCTRDLYFVVTGPDGFFSDEREDAEHRIEWLADGAPGFRIRNTCLEGRYQLEKTVIVDDRLNVVLMRSSFTALAGSSSDYRLHLYANPHLTGRGSENTAWIGEFKGEPMLFARRGDVALALACSRGFPEASAGFIDKSDGLDQLRKKGRLDETYLTAECGNVALVGEIDLADGSPFTVALGFGLGSDDAAFHATAGLQRDFDAACDLFIERWQTWQRSLKRLDADSDVGRDLYRTSAAILRSHTNKSTPGAVASLAIPWGDYRGDDDLMLGAYHLVWTRDLVQHGGGLLAIGADAEVRQLLDYLMATQEADGRWPQNMWVSGKPFWNGVQIDQAVQPTLLADLALREGVLDQRDQVRLWPMVQRAASFVLRYGASTQQDRWEEELATAPIRSRPAWRPC